MLMTNDSELVNTNTINKERKLAAIRSEIIEMPAEKALDVILDSPFPATLVQSFPDQDLHFLMYNIGKEDFIPVLSLASSQQWEYILDVEVWNNDRLDMTQMTNILSLLYKADPQRLLRWTLKEKTEFLEYYLFKNMEIRIREHDEDPSDFGDDFATIDSIFYFRFPHSKDKIETNESDELMISEVSDTAEGSDNSDSYGKETEDEDSENVIYDDTEIIGPETTETLITNMLNTLADMDMSVLYGMLLETGTVIPAETEEEEFRLKNVRLAEKGFLPPHEAVAVYQPLKTEDLKKRPSIFLTKPFVDSDLPYPPLYPGLMLQKQGILKQFSTNRGKNLFASALEHLNKNEDIAINLQSELAFLINSVVSADKKIVRSREELENIVEKTCCYLNLGMELIHSELTVSSLLNGSGTQNIKKNSVLTPEQGAFILSNYTLKDIFRVGSGAGIALKERARNWYTQSYIAKIGLALAFLDESWFAVVGGLFLDKPLFFDNYKNGVLYRPFTSIQDIEYTTNILESIIAIDKMTKIIEPDPDLISIKFLTWKTLFMTLWAMKRMGIEKSSDGYFIPLNKFKPFFVQLLNLKSGKQKNVYSGGKPDKKDEQSEPFGKIAKVARDDFFIWLGEAGIVKENDEISTISGSLLKSTTRKIFNEVFDEIEDEYGSIVSEDVDPKVIYHFIVQ
ncbi:MAG: hypothetical protein HQK73_05760 [Desulfamplus sp.]|nr:hypothetical protein [Desulfamplus sp.]